MQELSRLATRGAEDSTMSSAESYLAELEAKANEEIEHGSEVLAAVADLRIKLGNITIATDLRKPISQRSGAEKARSGGGQ